MRGTKRYVEAAKWRVLVQKSDAGYKALCVMLVFEGPPVTSWASVSLLVLVRDGLEL